MDIRTFAISIALASGLGGCVTSGPHHWGEDATWRPGLSRLRESAIDAAASPRVWLPLAGAAVFQIDGWDRKVSNWARENTPVFGSQQAADTWSDRLRTASSVAYFTTVVLTPGPDELGPWMRDKSQGLLVGLGAIAVTGATTTVLKDITDRTRPNGEGSGDQSMPSGHASHSAVLTGLAHDNLEAMDLGSGTRLALDAGLDALTLGTSWARVEAGAHFPSDTLVGMALGNFVSRFFDEAFLRAAPDESGRVSFALQPHGVSLRWQLTF